MISFLKHHSSFVLFLAETCVLFDLKCLKSNFLDLILHLLLVNSAFLSVIWPGNVYKISFFWSQDVHLCKT